MVLTSSPKEATKEQGAQSLPYEQNHLSFDLINIQNDIILIEEGNETVSNSEVENFEDED